MRLLLVFIRYELVTQFRSTRFRGIALAYLVICSVPAAVMHFFAERARYAVGAGAFAAATDAVQPLATTLLAAALCVDGIARERDEGSLAVVSLAPISATGYVLRRWIALLVVLLPVTVAPRIVAAALASHSTGTVEGLESIAFGWLAHALPSAVIVSALALALGTITGRVVVALIAGMGLFTVGLGITNDLLAHVHRSLSGPGVLVAFHPEVVTRYIWALRGWWAPPLPTAAGYPLRRELAQIVNEGMLGAGVTGCLLGLSCLYLRRTKPDLRPWRIDETDRLRSFKRMFNRLREEYRPDGGRERAETIAVLLAVAMLVAAVVTIFRKQDAMEALAAERYAALTSGPQHMIHSVVPLSLAVDGSVQTNGAVATTATVTLRNDDAGAQPRLAFSLNPYMRIERVTASRGDVRVERTWDRVGVHLDPPLEPRESRTFTFLLRGEPGTHQFWLRRTTSFRTSWRRYVESKSAFDLSDLSVSSWIPRADEVRVGLEATDVAPIPRYTAWNLLDDGGWDENPYVPEEHRPSAPLRIRLTLPRGMTAADACGTTATSTIESRCTMPVRDYALTAARFAVTELAPGVRFAHLPAHALLARTHGPALAGSIELARSAWPSLDIPPRALFVEEPRGGEELREFRPGPRGIITRGTLHRVPESTLVRLEPLDTKGTASMLVRGALFRARRVVPSEQQMFAQLYDVLADLRTGNHKGDAVVPGMGAGMSPERSPIVKGFAERRLPKVLTDVEHRIGGDRLMQGVDDFLAAGPKPGTARELIEAIARRGGVSLDRVWTDYFEGEALPRLTLADVQFTKRGAAWEVTGVVRNDDTGEVFCPVVLRTAYGSLRTTLRIDSKESVPFSFRSEHEPRTLQLDPDHVVYRFAAIGTIDSVDYRGTE